MYSVASLSSFEEVESLHEELVRLKGTSPILTLVGNKCDKAYERVVSREDGLAMARRLGCDFMETSAKTAMNVDRLFTELVRKLRLHKALEEQKNVDASPVHPVVNRRPRKKQRPSCVIL